jgi:hypothetical protein
MKVQHIRDWKFVGIGQWKWSHPILPSLPSPLSLSHTHTQNSRFVMVPRYKAPLTACCIGIHFCAFFMIDRTDILILEAGKIIAMQYCEILECMKLIQNNA